MDTSKNHVVSSAILGIYRILIISFTLLSIYFAKTIVIPLTIAALLTFLLSPLVTKLEKWLGRIFSILTVVIFVFFIIGFTGYIFARHLFLFGSSFPKYYEILQKKFQSFQFPQNELFDRLSHIFGNLKEDLLGNFQFEFKLIDLGTNVLNLAQTFFGSFFNFLSITGIILLLVVFMLFHREDILGRIIKLAGQSKIGATTNAINDAGERVSSYLYRLLIVNILFGLFVTIGLSLIGIPNAVLWGCLAAVLRFVPYIGAWIAAIIPIALSLIIAENWYVPLLTISFFIVVELTTAYVVEPYYYGEGTGVSSFALVLAAIFWTWLWGPIGLLLSTPLTVCLVVLGQNVSNMKFLQVLLSQESGLTPKEEFYHRILSLDSSEAMDLIESYLEKNSLLSLYDLIVIPIIAQAEWDFQRELIDSQQKEDVNQNVREIIELLTINQQKEVSQDFEKPRQKILCLSAETARDEIGMKILAQVLSVKSFEILYARYSNIHEIFEIIDKENPQAICITAVAPFVLSKIRLLCTKLHQHRPSLSIVICLLGSSKMSTQILEKFYIAGASTVEESLSQVINTLRGL